jgi:hypothetical protein
MKTNLFKTSLHRLCSSHDSTGGNDLLVRVWFMSIVHTFGPTLVVASLFGFVCSLIVTVPPHTSFLFAYLQQNKKVRAEGETCHSEPPS